jgi:hypothetical protein
MVLSRPPLTYSNKASVSQEADTEGQELGVLLAQLIHDGRVTVTTPNPELPRQGPPVPSAVSEAA